MRALFVPGLILLALALVACGGDTSKNQKKKKKTTTTEPATGGDSAASGAAGSGADDSGDEAPGSPGSLFHVGRVVGEDVEVGKGPTIEDGGYYALEYTMSVAGVDKPFRQSKKGKLLKFEYRAGEILPGWEKGLGVVKTMKKVKLEPMKVGGKRKLLIPGEWAYGHPDCTEKPPPGVKKTDTLMVIFTIHAVDPMED